MSRAGSATRSQTAGRAAFTIDAQTGRLLVENPKRLPDGLRDALENRLGAGVAIACASPGRALTLPPTSADELAAGPSVRLAGYWHDSLIEGPGRRSVAKLQGCPIHCRGCIAPESWNPTAGFFVPVNRLADALLDPAYERDGVSLVGGEPTAQPTALLALVRALRIRGCLHILLYSGYTCEALRRRAESQAAIGAVLDEIDILIDGPYVAGLADSAGPWTGSGNQRVIDLAASRRLARVVLLARPEVVNSRANSTAENEACQWS